MHPHCVFLYRRIVDPSGFSLFFSRVSQRLELKGVMFHDGRRQELYRPTSAHTGRDDRRRIAAPTRNRGTSMASLALLRPLRGPGISSAHRAAAFFRDLIDRFFSLLDDSEPSNWILYAR